MTDENRNEKLARLAKLKAGAKAAYDKMCDVHTRWQFELADEMLSEAWRIAQELSMKEEAEAIRLRHQHIRDVSRHQFRGPT
jgi:hypothetical protein